MKSTLLALLLLGILSGHAADTPWIWLFNGTNLSGWKIVGPTNPAPVEVADGMIVLRQRNQTFEHTFLATENNYTNYILELDLKDDPGFNSGILFHAVAATADAKVRLNGNQMKIDNTARAWIGGILDDYGDKWKWLYDLNDDARARAAFKLGEWAHIRIERIGLAARVWVNGVPTANLIDDTYPEGCIAFKIHMVKNGSDTEPPELRLKNLRLITDQPERFTQPMELMARHSQP